MLASNHIDRRQRTGCFADLSEKVRCAAIADCADACEPDQRRGDQPKLAALGKETWQRYPFSGHKLRLHGTA